MLKALIRSRIYAVVMSLLLVVVVAGRLQTTSATESEPRVKRKFPAAETKHDDSVQDPLAPGKASVRTSRSKGSIPDTVVVNNASENQSHTLGPEPKHTPQAVQACPEGTSCSSTRKVLNTKESESAQTHEEHRAPPRAKKVRQSLSDEEIEELHSDPHVETLSAAQQQHWNNNNNNDNNDRRPWVLQPSSQHLYDNTQATASRHIPLFHPQFQSSARLQGVGLSPTRQRTKRSGEAAGSLVSDYGEVVAGAGGGADVVVNLLAEVAGLQTMVKGLATALQTNLQGVGSQFTTVHQQALELQQRFESAFNDLNATVRSLHSQVSAEVAALRADVYRLHAAMQGATPTGQRLIVQPDRVDPTRPKAIGVDCASLYRAGARESGVYMLQPDPADNTTKLAAYCDMKTAGGGWTVIQRRVDGSEDFFRSWRSYKQGFGSLLHDYWLGLDSIHRLTKFGNTHLRVELHDWENQTRVGEYRYVRVMDESDGYRILAGSASGDAGDPFHSVAYTSRLQSMRFSTFDVDNDMNARSNCARTFTSGWWFNSCFSVNLNGVWYGSASYVGPSMNGVVWDLWDHQSKGYSLRATEMKLRTEDF